MGSSTERVVSPILISPSLNLGEGEGWSVKASFYYITLHYMVIIFFSCFLQALRDDVRRQTDRENQLQTRYSNLLYERGATYSQMQHR